MWFKPRSPLDIREKAWVEDALLRVAWQFGLAPLMSATVVIPDRAFYSANGPYGGTVPEARRILESICTVLGLDPLSIELEIVADAAAGHHVLAERGRVHVPESVLPTADRLAALLAHRLSGQRALEMDESAAGPSVAGLASVVAVYYGLGVLLTEGSMSEQHHASISVPGSLPSRMLGYAMALCAWVRGDVDPAWKRRLRPDALAAFTGGMHYVGKTRDSQFDRGTASSPSGSPAATELVRQLKSGSPSARIAALWKLRDPRWAGEALEAVMACLETRDPVLREEAAATLAVYGPAAAAAVPMLIDMLRDRHEAVRAECASALGAIGDRADGVVPELAERLADSERRVVVNSAAAIKGFGAEAQPATSAVLEAIKWAVIRCDHPLIDALCATLFHIHPEPLEAVAEFFAEESDPELRDQVVLMISESRRQ